MNELNHKRLSAINLNLLALYHDLPFFDWLRYSRCILYFVNCPAVCAGRGGGGHSSRFPSVFIEDLD